MAEVTEKWISEEKDGQTVRKLHVKELTTKSGTRYYQITRYTPDKTTRQWVAQPPLNLSKWEAVELAIAVYDMVDGPYHGDDNTTTPPQAKPHKCRIERCTLLVEHDGLMCPHHWRMVPQHLQTRILAIADHSVNTTKTPDWKRAVAEAIKLVNEEVA